mmetsp:Transcript_15196/g.32755  ORF Transcript_15196/g.32755 Transcript_15196/m.32755 type:complete len:157 (-) Transcript_15196:634-1104(-)
MQRKPAERTRESLDQKILEYESFMDRLKVDLSHAYTQRTELQQKIDAYRDLKLNTEMLMKEDSSKPIRTLVNLGSDFFCQAEVPNTRWIYVDVGLGFHVQLTPAETAKHAEERMKAIEVLAAKQSDQIAAIKANIKLVGEGVRELMCLPQAPSGKQ